MVIIKLINVFLTEVINVYDGDGKALRQSNRKVFTMQGNVGFFKLSSDLR